jgi:hypothetical protein
LVFGVNPKSLLQEELGAIVLTDVHKSSDTVVWVMRQNSPAGLFSPIEMTLVE